MRSNWLTLWYKLKGHKIMVDNAGAYVRCHECDGAGHIETQRSGTQFVDVECDLCFGSGELYDQFFIEEDE